MSPIGVHLFKYLEDLEGIQFSMLIQPAMNVRSTEPGGTCVTRVADTANQPPPELTLPEASARWFLPLRVTLPDWVRKMSTWSQLIFINIHRNATSYTIMPLAVIVKIWNESSLNEWKWTTNCGETFVVEKPLGYSWISCCVLCAYGNCTVLCGLEDAFIWEAGGVFIQSCGMFRWSAICLPCLEHTVIGNVHTHPITNAQEVDLLWQHPSFWKYLAFPNLSSRKIEISK